MPVVAFFYFVNSYCVWRYKLLFTQARAYESGGTGLFSLAYLHIN